MNSNQATQLVLDYRPSEFTGWEWGKTLGGHHSSKEFKHGGSSGGIGAPTGAGHPSNASNAPPFSATTMAESFLGLDTGRKDRSGKGIIDILGGIKWGYQAGPVQAS